MPEGTKSALATWREKLEHLRRELAVCSDPAQKFTLREQIDEARSMVTELEVETRAVPDAAEAEVRDRGDGGGVDAWLDQVTRDHRFLADHFERPAELRDLERAWVRLDLALPSRGEELTAKELFRRATLERFLDLDPAEHPWVTRRWIVEGDPGAGKTTLLRHLAGRLARDRDTSRIPIFVSLPRLVEPVRPLLDYLADEIGALCGDELPGVLDEAGREGRLLLLLDGYDEVPPERRKRCDRLLDKIVVDWPRSTLVVASRPIGLGEPRTGFHKLVLQPLDEEQRKRFLVKWLASRATPRPEDEAARAAAHFDAEHTLRELSKNPLHLTLLTVLWERGVEAPRRRSELYDAIFDLLLQGRHKEEPVAIAAIADTREALRHLAYAMTRDDLPSEEPEKLERRLWDDELDDVRARLVKLWGKNLRAFLDDVHERTYVLGPHDGPRAGWRFWHRTFREALTAEVLAATYEREGEEAVLEHARQIQGDEGRWAEPYALLAGRIDKPDDLVRALVHENRPLGLRAVATAQGLREETLREVLELTDDWEERRKVFERIPELLDDAERSLALVDRLRRVTRDGNDLYFLGEAVAEAARRWPDFANHAERLRSRFFEHVPAPPEELFQWIETKDGRVELWREIPAGTFEMGSPEGESPYDDESPRHQVEVASPFRMGAVTVTNAHYAAFDPGRADADRPHHPVVNVTWFEAMAFCRWLSSLFPWARGARLPTEEEWEYACRAGTTTRYWRGEKEADLDRVGWYDEDFGSQAHRVGEKPANPWGLYDVHGNVWEWTLSPWTKDYSDRKDGNQVDPAAVDPAAVAATSGGHRMSRGGSCWNVAVSARAACRDNGDPDFGHGYRGFRVLLPLLPPRDR